VRVLGLANVETHCLDLTTLPHPAPDLRADVIISVMALHHIADLPAILRTLVQLLTPGGYLALADLDSEDGSFHEDKSGVHHAGIDRDWLLAQLTALGLQQLSASTAHVMERPSPGGTRRYPIFLACGREPA
jgi:2-polyprenyl-3-methyl-5-hydroxy-6-metoxy-1,4-benzoquinol methylase